MGGGAEQNRLRLALADETFVFVPCAPDATASDVLHHITHKHDVTATVGLCLFREEENGRFRALEASDPVFVDDKDTLFLKFESDCVSDLEIVELLAVSFRAEAGDYNASSLKAKKAIQTVMELSLAEDEFSAAVLLFQLQKRGLISGTEGPNGGTITVSYKEEKANLPKPLIQPAQCCTLDFILMQMNPIELARQLALIEQEMFFRIDLDNEMASRTAAEKSVSIKSWYGWSYQLEDWVTRQIQRQPSKKLRVEACKYFLQLCSECIKLNNYSTLSTIVSSLNSTKLNDVDWAKMSKKLRNQKDEFTKMTSMIDDFFQLRTAIGSSTPPLVPFLPLYMKDLSMVDSTSPTAAPLLAHINSTLSGYQSKRYQFRKLYRFHRWLSPTGSVFLKQLPPKLDAKEASSIGCPTDVVETLQSGLKRRKKMSGRKRSDSCKDGGPNLANASLNIKVVSAVGLWPLADKTTVSSFCQVVVGKKKRTTRVKLKSMDPTWNEEFVFEMESAATALKFQIFNQEGSQPSTKDDLLGSFSGTVGDLDFSAGASIKKEFVLRTKCKPTSKGTAKPKLKAEFTLIRDKSEPATSRAATSASAQAAPDNENPYCNRGQCGTASCTCTKYAQKKGMVGGPCATCTHPPAKHALIQATAEKFKCPNCGYFGQSGVGALVEIEPSTPPRNVAEANEAFKGSAGIFSGASWELDSSEIELNKQLGEGSFAKVFRGTYRAQEVAVKVLKEKADKKALIEFEKEFLIMSALRSPHVVFFYGATVQPSLCMVLEFCHQGTLTDVFNSDETYGWERLLRNLVDTLKGLLCLHHWKPLIVHRDLKPLNLLVDENDKVKVSDFGLSRFDGQENFETLKKLRGTYAYLAPEVYFQNPYSIKSDIYSVGVIMWEMAYRVINGEHQQPYAEYPELTFDFQIIIKSAKEKKRPTIPASTPKAFAALVSRCWADDPDERPLTRELMDEVKALQGQYRANREEWDKSVGAGRMYLEPESDDESTGTASETGGD